MLVRSAWLSKAFEFDKTIVALLVKLFVVRPPFNSAPAQYKVPELKVALLACMVAPEILISKFCSIDKLPEKVASLI